MDFVQTFFIVVQSFYVLKSKRYRFLKRFRQFGFQAMSPIKINILQFYCTSSPAALWQPQFCKRHSKLPWAICVWSRAIFNYHKSKAAYKILIHDQKYTTVLCVKNMYRELNLPYLLPPCVEKIVEYAFTQDQWVL